MKSSALGDRGEIAPRTGRNGRDQCLVIMVVIITFFMGFAEAGPGQCRGREVQGKGGFHAAFLEMYDNNGLVPRIG